MKLRDVETRQDFYFRKCRFTKVYQGITNDLVKTVSYLGSSGYMLGEIEVKPVVPSITATIGE